MLYIDSPVQEVALKLINDGDSSFLKDIIGKGSYGLVIKSIYKKKLVAAKIIDIRELSKKQSVDREENALNLYHPNIIHVIKISRVNHQAIIIMESFESATLQHLIDSTLIKSYHCLNILMDIIRGLEFCHRNHIVHFDVKPLNVLVGRESDQSSKSGYVCKLCDFGASTSTIENRSDHIFKPWGIGTVRYMSPSALRGCSASPSDDIYSFGITMWQLLTKKTPYEVLKRNDLVAYNVVKLNMRPDSSNLQQQIATGTLNGIVMESNPDLNLQAIANKSGNVYCFTSPPRRVYNSVPFSTNKHKTNAAKRQKPNKPKLGDIDPLRTILETNIPATFSARFVKFRCERIYSECWRSNAEARPAAYDIYKQLSDVLLHNY